MPVAISNHIEVSAFYHATRAPAVDRAIKTVALGHAMTSVLESLEGLKEALADHPRCGEDKAEALIEQYGDVGPLWEAISDVLEGRTRKRGKAA